MHGLIPVPKLVDHEEKRREIAAGAAEAIAEMGIDQVTMVDIAQAAGCTTGCVTHYFDNKDEILLAALRYVDESMTVRLRGARSQTPALVGPVENTPGKGQRADSERFSPISERA